MNENHPRNGRDPRRVTGVVLIAIGLALFVLQIATETTVTIMFLVGGAIFIAGYFSRRSYGLLVPGCLLVGMALGQLGEEYVDSLRNPTLIGLGIGFLAIFAVDRIHSGQTSWWPLIPGFILFFMGLDTGRLDMGIVLSKGWPLILVFAGLLYFTGRIGSRHRGGGGGRRDDRGGGQGSGTDGP
jgi:hypothetical protein